MKYNYSKYKTPREYTASLILRLYLICNNINTAKQLAEFNIEEKRETLIDFNKWSMKKLDIETQLKWLDQAKEEIKTF
jgi:hypothetical protein